ncbi:MAG: hypothetical protein U0941_04470 [Planctomycetaceae bacterium]
MALTLLQRLGSQEEFGTGIQKFASRKPRRPKRRLGHPAIMITFDNQTLRLAGFPAFTLVVAIVFLAALAGLTIGVFNWRHPAGKISVLVSLLIMSLFAVAMTLVMITVESGSMN